MADKIIYKGRGNAEMYDDFMDFINYVFGFNGNNRDFKKLLPKLYNVESDPCYNNYVVTEDGKLKAAIGAFDSAATVGGETLKCRGIGNVAVHPYSRSKGYMIDCMNLAIDDMIKDGIDYSILGGQRQRYNYFGFEKAGPEYDAHITQTNLRHCFRDVPFTELEIRDIDRNETELIDKIYDLHCSRPLRTLRPREQFYDICISWQSPLRAILKNNSLIGYFIGELHELTLADNGDFEDVIRNYVRKYGDCSISLPAWETELIDKAADICENISLGTCYMFSIFNYKKVVGAYLKFKASMEALPDGSFTVLIHGKAGDEKLKISVFGNETKVEDYDGEADIELEHREAAKFFFGLTSPYRTKLAPALRQYFPLPLYVDQADHV